MLRKQTTASASGGQTQADAGLRPALGRCPSRTRAPVARSVQPAGAAPVAAPSYPPRQSRRTIVQRDVRVRANEYVGAVTAEPHWRFGVVVARFNSLVTKQLLEGVHEVFTRHGVPRDNVDVAWVPGSFELPVVARNMAATGQYNAVVCIGAVIQGATSHYDAVVSATTSGVLSAASATGVPVIFGVLTTDTLEQALDRAGGKVGNKGGEAAFTAIEMASLLDQLGVAGKAVKPRPSY